MTERDEEGQEENEEGSQKTEDIKIEELRETIKSIKGAKAPEQDGIANEAWKIGRELLEEEMLYFLNRIWNGGEVPKEWKVGAV